MASKLPAYIEKIYLCNSELSINWNLGNILVQIQNCLFSKWSIWNVRFIQKFNINSSWSSWNNMHLKNVITNRSVLDIHVCIICSWHISLTDYNPKGLHFWFTATQPKISFSFESGTYISSYFLWDLFQILLKYVFLWCV